MPSMRVALVAALVAAFALPAAVSAQPGSTGAFASPLSPRNANYTIAARLDPATRTITGSETIMWRNTTSTPATELQFHLYWNAWKNTRSTFMRERALAGGSSAEPSRRADEWARIEVGTVKIDGVDRTATKRFIAPDDDNADDETVMAVPLTQPLGPGATAT